MNRTAVLLVALVMLVLSGCGASASNGNSGVPTPGTIGIGTVVNAFTRDIVAGNAAAASTYLNPNYREGPGCPPLSHEHAKGSDMICGLPKPSAIGVDSVTGSGDNATVGITLSFKNRKSQALTLTLANIGGQWEITQTLRSDS